MASHEILALIALAAGFFIGKWSGRLEAERKHAEEMASRLADDYDQMTRKSRG